ncbi:MAG TPA: WYL domain-containing protein [Gemmatimonadaceae bacterium]|nr:WYL domain-containing protein [Gemmatimonadaceae bacterium]
MSPPRKRSHPPASKAKVQRLVDLLAALLTRRPLTFAEIAEQVPAYRGDNKASVKRMFERDKRELRLFGVPISTMGAEGSEDASYRVDARDFYLPYLSVVTPRGLVRPLAVDKYGYRSLQALTFNADELEVIAQGVARARQLGNPTLDADLDSAVRKLAFDLPMDASIPADDPTRIVPAGPRADHETLDALAGALHARKRATFEYHSLHADTVARREVEPYGLFFVNAHWYLVARDVAKDALRNFRVSRIRHVKVNAAREDTPDYEIPTDFVLRHHAAARQAWELGDDEPLQVTVRFTGATGPVRAAARLGESVEGEPDVRRFAVRRRDAFVRWLLSFSGDALPLGPATVVQEFREQVDATRALYDTEAR